jgi:ribosomal protein S18 acetylase RimI-like enzyme
MDVTVEQGALEDVEALRALWLQMLAHHRAVLDGALPVTGDDSSWAATANEYRSWFDAGDALLLLARAADGELAGYLACHLDASSRTFDLPRLGNVDSLVVSTGARGAGIGSLLLDACRVELGRRGIRFWTIGVVEGNDRALELYQRFGFRPFYRDLVGEIDGGPGPEPGSATEA